MSQPTVESIIDRGLDLADMAGSAFPDDARLLDYANAALESVHGLLVQAGFGDYVASSIELSLEAGQERMALPEDFLKLLALFRLHASRRYEVPQFNLRDMHGYRSDASGNETFELLYVPRWRRLEMQSEIPIYVPTQWEELAVLGVAKRLHIRESSTQYQVLRAEEDLARQKIIAEAEPRDAGGDNQVVDVTGRYRAVPDSIGDLCKYRYRILGSNIWVVETQWRGV